MSGTQRPGEQPPLSLLIIASAGIDAAKLVRDTYNTAHEDQYGERLGDAEVVGVVAVAWTAQFAVDPPRVAWRVSLVFDDGEITFPDGNESFAEVVTGDILDLRNEPESGIIAVVKLADPVQLHGHTDLYREVYGIEMSLREVVSYIFAVEFPEKLIDALAETMVKPASAENLPPDPQLIKHGENRFFYILFDKYAILNRPPDVSAAHIANALQGGTNLDEVREKLDMRPIKEERHAGFIASLQTLMDPLERVRNAVAHNRTVPQNVRENYHKAAKTLREAVDGFWTREAEELRPDPPSGAPPI